MQDQSLRPDPGSRDNTLHRLVAETLESSDAVALKASDLAERAARHNGNGDPKRNFAVLRTQTALKQTESVLAQTARSLQRTAGVLGPVPPTV